MSRSSVPPQATSLAADSTARRTSDTTSRVLGAIAALSLAGFALLTALLLARVELPFDAPLRNAALQLPASFDLWNFISNAANFPLIGVGAAIVAWMLFRHRRREAVLVFITLVLVTAGSEGVKQLVHRPRPPGSETVVPGVIYSFPSGHELEAVTILGIVGLLVWRSSAPRAVRMLVAIAVALFWAAVAVARVAINAHWPSDVLGGLLGGIGVLALVAILTRPRRVDETASPDGPRRDAQHHG